MSSSELGYQSSLVASSMRSHRTGVIGVLVPAFEPFSAEILKGVGAARARHRIRPARLQRIAGRHGRGVGAPLGEPPERHAHRRRRSWSRRRSSTSRREVPDRRDRSAHRTGRPADGRVRQLRRRAAGDPLPDRARPHAASASSPGRPDLRSSVLRDAGYRSALLEAGIPFDPALVGVGRYQEDASRELAHELLLARSTARPRSSRRTTSRRSRCSRSPPSSGIAVPDELSVIGFDDIPEASRHVRRRSRTVRQPMQRLGRSRHQDADRAHERRDPGADARAPAHAAGAARDDRAAL